MCSSFELLTLPLKRLLELVPPLCPCAIHLKHGDSHNHDDYRSYQSEYACRMFNFWLLCSGFCATDLPKVPPIVPIDWMPE